jgi:hypothetical protein
MLRGSLGEGRLDRGIDKAFGAEIKVALPESNRRQLFFVGSSSFGVDLSALVRPRGGRVVLEGETWAIAELGLNEAMALQKTEDVAFVGGISLDPQRFAAFGKLVGFRPL